MLCFTVLFYFLVYNHNARIIPSDFFCHVSFAELVAENHQKGELTSSGGLRTF